MLVNKSKLQTNITETANQRRSCFSSKSKAYQYLQEAIKAADRPRSKLSMIRNSLLSICHAIHNSISLKRASVKTQLLRVNRNNNEIYARNRKADNERAQSEANSEMAYAVAAALIGSLVLGDNDLYKAFEGTEFTERSASELTVTKIFQLNDASMEKYIQALNTGKLAKEDELELLCSLVDEQNV